MAEITIYKTVVGNDAPNLAFTLQRNGVNIDVTGATVTLAIRNERTGDTTNSSNQSCTLTTPASGIVTYAPAIADFPVAGRYVADAKIVYPVSGKIEHVAQVLLIIARGGIS